MPNNKSVEVNETSDLRLNIRHSKYDYGTYVSQR